MSRLLLAIAFLTATAALPAQPAPTLHGTVEGRTYISPTGAFKIAIPVLPELGGQITDTPNVVTFQDGFNVHVTIAVFPQDATQRWELSTRGTKDYLAYFFANFVLTDFRQTFPGVNADTAKFVPNLQGGALIAHIVLPGGSMFMDRVPQLSADRIPIAKRGNLLFVRGGDIFVISTELAERVIEGRAYNKTAAEEDQILRQRLEDIVGKMTFLKPATPATSASRSVEPTSAPAQPAK